MDASSACCACGGGVFGRPCEQRTTGGETLRSACLSWVSFHQVGFYSSRSLSNFPASFCHHFNLEVPELFGFRMIFRTGCFSIRYSKIDNFLVWFLGPKTCAKRLACLAVFCASGLFEIVWLCKISIRVANWVLFNGLLQVLCHGWPARTWIQSAAGGISEVLEVLRAL